MLVRSLLDADKEIAMSRIGLSVVKPAAEKPVLEPTEAVSYQLAPSALNPSYTLLYAKE